MRKEYIIGIILVVLVGAGLAYLLTMPAGKSLMPDLDANGERYKEIASPSGFVNTDKITIGELIGKKVILVDFMTYSCINCQRTFPYVTAWYKKYRDQGLEIVGIHTPEFAFEKDIDNVREAMRQHGIQYPVVLDNDYATWRAYENNYWPRKYLIDIHGNIVYDHIGEGAYEETEMKIRELLKERAIMLGESSSLLSDSLITSHVPESQRHAGSPEIYFGASRNEYLGNGKKFSEGEQEFLMPSSKIFNTLYLGGRWNIASEYAQNLGEVSIVFKYSAKNVYMVAAAKDPIQMEILQDGEFLKAITIQNEDLYKLIEGEFSGEHTLELRIKNPGLQAFTFTFG